MKVISRYLSLNKKNDINIFKDREKVCLMPETGELEFDTPNHEYELSFATVNNARKSKVYIINNHRIDRAVIQAKPLIRITNIIASVFLAFDFVLGDIIFPSSEPFGVDTYVGFGLLFIFFLLNLIFCRNNYFNVVFYDKDSERIDVEEYHIKKKMSD